MTQNIKPVIFLEGEYTEADIEKFKEEHKISRVVDNFKDQIEELFEISHPELISHEKYGVELSKFLERVSKKEKLMGDWIYYPWKNCIVHILPEADFRKVRISRNKNLITDEEQILFRNARVGIAGLNVGNPGAICMVLEGGAQRMKFADFDTLSLANLNRFRAGLCDMGVNKSILSAHQAYEINPYLDIEIFDEGLSKKNIKNFLLNPKLDLLIEEMDNLSLKIDIRRQAQKNKIPVLMVTGNGANIIIDIERYDIDSSLPILNGYLQKDVIEKTQKEKISFNEKVLLARDFMGVEHLSERLQTSFLDIGKSLAGIPQIAEATFLRGAALSYFARQILTKKKVSSGRYTLNLDDVLNKSSFKNNSS